MSKDSSIKVFAENVGDTNPRPVNNIPVWIENVSAIGGGGGDIPSDVSGKWEGASDCVQTNSASWNDSVKKTAGTMQRINMGGGQYIDLGLSNRSNEPGVRINGKTTLGTNYLKVMAQVAVANIDNTVNIFGSDPSIEIKNNKTNVSSKLTNTELTFKNGADSASLNLYDISALKSASGAGGSVSLPITGSSNYTTATYDTNSALFDYNETQGEPTHNKISINPDPNEGFITIYNSSDDDETNTTLTISDSYIQFKDAEDNFQEIAGYSVASWNDTYSTVQSNSANWGGGSALNVEEISAKKIVGIGGISYNEVTSFGEPSGYMGYSDDMLWYQGNIFTGSLNNNFENYHSLVFPLVSSFNDTSMTYGDLDIPDNTIMNIEVVDNTNGTTANVTGKVGMFPYGGEGGEVNNKNVQILKTDYLFTTGNNYTVTIDTSSYGNINQAWNVNALSATQTTSYEPVYNASAETFVVYSGVASANDFVASNGNSLSSMTNIQIISNSSQATGSNILYVVTGSN